MNSPILFSNLTLAAQQVNEWKQRQEKIVFTNGCFDIFHAGHAQYLEEARQLGDRLIVGLNSDQSVKKLKGKSRPIQSLENRAAVLASLRCVDMVIEFDEDTPIELIKKCSPNILVKGGDYRIEDMIGKDFIESIDGEVKILSFKKDISTSSIIHRIQHLPHED